MQNDRYIEFFIDNDMSTIDTRSSFSSRSEIEDADCNLDYNFSFCSSDYTSHTTPEITFTTLTLNEICLSVIMKEGFLKNVDDAAAVCMRVQDLTSNFEYQKLWDRVQAFLRNRGSMLVESYDHDDLQRHFGADLTLSLIKLHENRLNAEKKMAGYRSGQAIERTSMYYDGVQVNGSYPIEFLLEGTKWPDGVNPAKREEYLSEQDFWAIFKMDREKFMKLSEFMRVRLKKQHKLF